MRFLALETWPLLLIAALVLLLAILWSRRLRRRLLKRIGRPGALQTNASPVRRWLRRTLLLGAFVALGLAMLRPTTGEHLAPERRPARNLVLLVDASPSMGVTDCGGLSRLNAAKLFVREAIDRRPGDRFGLISFAGVAFPECPCTPNRSMLLARLNELEAGSLPVSGTDLDNALSEASQLLTTNPPPGSAILVFSDGDRLSTNNQALAQTWTNDVPIHTIAFGTPGEPSAIPDKETASAADPDALAELATATGGLALHAGIETLGPQLNQLDQTLDRLLFNGKDIAPVLYRRATEWYILPAAIALAFLLLHFLVPLRSNRWHPLHLLPFLLLFAPPSPAQDNAQDNAQDDPAATAAADLQQTIDTAFDSARESERHVMLLFTASDWSAANETFDREIRAHDRYKKWVASRVSPVEIDLPRVGIDPAVRQARRALLDRHNITAYPTALFLHATTRAEMGRLHHEEKGPAEWVRRADLILAGASAAGDSAASFRDLPKSMRNFLSDENAEPLERAIRLYNQVLAFVELEPDLAAKSDDRFRLLDDLLRRATRELPDEALAERHAVANALATLHHRRARAEIPDLSQDPAAAQRAGAGGENAGTPNPHQALRRLMAARRLYGQAARALPGHSNLESNLTLLEADRRRCQDVIDFYDTYEKALEGTYELYQQETEFRNALRHFVTTAAPVNDEEIEDATAAISNLIDIATRVEFPETSNFVAALEDIELAPTPHDDRHLHDATQHIRDALEHLIEDQPTESASRRPEEGEGGEESDEEGEEGGRSDPRDESEKEPEKADKPNDRDRERDNDRLRKSDREGGTLRDRLLESLKKDKPVNPEDDH